MVKNKRRDLGRAGLPGNSSGYFSIACLWRLSESPCIVGSVRGDFDTDHIKSDNKRRMRYMEITVTQPSSERTDMVTHKERRKENVEIKRNGKSHPG